MKPKYLLLPVLILLSSSTFMGCFGVDSDFREVKSLVMNSTDDRFQKDIEFSVGPMGLSLAKVIVKLNDDNEDADVILNNISEVQIGIYKKSGWSEQHYDYSFFHDIDTKLEKEDWHYIVRHIENGEITGVYVKYQDENINKMYVINIQNDKLSLVRVEGNLENIITYAIKDKGFDHISFNH